MNLAIRGIDANLGSRTASGESPPSPDFGVMFDCPDEPWPGDPPR